MLLAAHGVVGVNNCCIAYKSLMNFGIDLSIPIKRQSLTIMSDATAATGDEGSSSQQLPPPNVGNTVVTDSASIATAPLILTTDTVTTNDVGDRIGNSTSGGRGTSNGRGGRIAMGGRGLVQTQQHQLQHGGRQYQPNTAGRNVYGRGRFQQQQPRPVQIHASSGVPFGHVPAYLPGSSSLVEELDSRVLLVMRDGKHIIGTLISFDQFGNMVLKDSIERQIVSVVDKASNVKRNYYSDIPLDGIYIARGESLVLVGEVHDEHHNPFMESVPLEKLNEISSSDNTDILPKLEWDFDTDLTA